MILSRRYFLRAGALAAVSAYVPGTFAAARDFAARDRWLAFYTHTGERLNTIFWSGGDYVAESLHDINHILRDPRNDQVYDIDRRLIDVLHALRSVIEVREPFHVISGYPLGGEQCVSPQPKQWCVGEQSSPGRKSD
jgi:uncharacterized protein YcbK (DUF882 family)